MKKYSVPVCVLLLICFMCFYAFSDNTITVNEPIRFPMKEGVEPYTPSVWEKSQPQSFNISYLPGSKTFEYRAPKEANYVSVRMREFRDGAWTESRGGLYATSKELAGVDRLEGTIVVSKPDTYQFVRRINYATADATISVAAMNDFSDTISASDALKRAAGVAYLHEHQQIVLDEEIPLIIWMYNDKYEIIGFDSLDKYFSQSEDFDVEFAVAMTVIFSAEPLD